MDDLQEKIGQILSDPQALEQLKSLGSMFGLNSNNSPTPPPPPQTQNPNESMNIPQNFMNDDTVRMITKIMPMLNSIKKEDESTILLEALRPFLGEARRAKLDQAKKMMQLLKILPFIKKSGIL